MDNGPVVLGHPLPDPKCKACGGNNKDMPCAYPDKREQQPGCLKYAKDNPVF